MSCFQYQPFEPLLYVLFGFGCMHRSVVKIFQEVAEGTFHKVHLGAKTNHKNYHLVKFWFVLFF